MSQTVCAQAPPDASYIEHDLEGKYFASSVRCKVVCEVEDCGCDIGKVVQGEVACSKSSIL